MKGALKTIAALAGLALAATACSNGSATPKSTSTTAAAGTRASNSSPRFKPPAAYGTVASVSGDTLEVQNSSGQTTVELTSATAITDTADASLSDVAAGDCVSVFGAPPNGSGGSSTPLSQIAASSVSISEPGPSGCERGLGGRTVTGGSTAGPGKGFQNFRGGSSNGQAPAGGQNLQNGTAASGSVTSVSAPDFVMQGRALTGFRRSSSSSTTTSSTLPPETSITVSTDSSTRFTKTGKGSPKDVTDGSCVVVQGSANSIGVVTATSLSITPAGPNGCALGFANPSGSGGFPGSSGSTGPGQSAGSAGGSGGGPVFVQGTGAAGGGA